MQQISKKNMVAEMNKNDISAGKKIRFPMGERTEIGRPQFIKIGSDMAFKKS